MFLFESNSTQQREWWGTTDNGTLKQISKANISFIFKFFWHFKADLVMADLCVKLTLSYKKTLPFLIFIEISRISERAYLASSGNSHGNGIFLATPFCDFRLLNRAPTT